MELFVSPGVKGHGELANEVRIQVLGDAQNLASRIILN